MLEPAERLTDSELRYRQIVNTQLADALVRSSVPEPLCSLSCAVMFAGGGSVDPIGGAQSCQLGHDDAVVEGVSLVPAGHGKPKNTTKVPIP
jgi:hypothetical protein